MNKTTTKRATKKTDKTPSKKSVKTADQYNDPSHNYLQYWEGRDYEDAAERIAIERLLKGKSFKTAADIGGGYGRLCVFLQEYADEVSLAEPSQQQLDIAEEFLKKHKKIKRVKTQADNLKFKDKSLDLITVIRVMHHLPDPTDEFNEFHRVLTDDGRMILEVANYAHARNRIKHFIKNKRLPVTPVDIRSEENKREDEIAFVNHNPKTVVSQLAHAGFKVEKVLSVSNLRSQRLKKLLPKSAMLAFEKPMQAALARAYFGPSVFFLVKKAK